MKHRKSITDAESELMNEIKPVNNKDYGNL